MSLRHNLKKYLPWPVLYFYRKFYYLPLDAKAAAKLLCGRTKVKASFGQKLSLVFKFYLISYKVDCPHTENELLTIARDILNIDPDVPGAILEAGAYHGGSTAKLSLVARLAGRELLVFDSFEGMPENSEVGGRSIFGREHHFPKGSHAVGLGEVRANVQKYGDISCTRLFKGFFKDTLPGLREPIAAACVNVDLEGSTRDCLKHVFPLIPKGGLFFSQDGHFPWIIELLRDTGLWEGEIGVPKPKMEGLGTSKLVVIHPHTKLME